MDLWNLLRRVIVVPDLWVAMQVLWLLGIGGYSRYLRIKDGWFKEPITSSIDTAEYAIMGAFLSVIATDLQLDGLLLFMKWRFIREWLKHEKKMVTTTLLSLSTLVLGLILSPAIGDWLE